MSRVTYQNWSEVARRDFKLALLTLALLVAVVLAFPGFAAPRNLAGVLDDTAILILLALGQMLVILVRGIDLSVAANLALCGMLAALFNRAFPGAGVLPALLLAMAAGGLLGALNGALVWKLRLPPIVVTLGTMSVYRGVIYPLSDGAWVNDNEMSAEFISFTRAQFLDSPRWPGWVCAALFIFLLRRWPAARNLYAAGGNPEAAASAGIDPGRMQFLAYTVCGAIAGLAGYLWVARFAVAYTDIALGFELQVIAACLIGGVAIAGGTGSALGVLLGCLFLGIIRSSLPLVGVSAFWQMFINGVVILAAVLLSARHQRQARNHSRGDAFMSAVRSWEGMLGVVLLAAFTVFLRDLALFPERRHALRRHLQFHRARVGRLAAGVADHRRRNRHLGGGDHRAGLGGDGIGRGAGRRNRHAGRGRVGNRPRGRMRQWCLGDLGSGAGDCGHDRHHDAVSRYRVCRAR